MGPGVPRTTAGASIRQCVFLDVDTSIGVGEKAP
jgi:hypothetical protein